MFKKLKNRSGSTLVTSVVMIIVLSIIASTVIILLSSTTNSTVKRLARREEKIVLTAVMYEALEKYNGNNQTIDGYSVTFENSENSENTTITIKEGDVVKLEVIAKYENNYTSYKLISWRFC